MENILIIRIENKSLLEVFGVDSLEQEEQHLAVAGFEFD